MKLSLLATTLALGLSVGLAAAQAAETAPAQVAVQPSASTQATEQASFSAYKSNVNAAVAVKTTGSYDQEDMYVGPHGFPLNGWKEISNPPS